MKKVLLSVLLCAVLAMGVVGCAEPDPIMDMYTQDLLPGNNANYSVGSNASPYYEGHFTNLYANTSIISGNTTINGTYTATTGNFTNINVLAGGRVRAWDAANVHSVWLRHDGTNGILQTDFSALYLYSPSSTVGHLGDSAGVYEFQIEDSGNARVAAIDSDGNIDAIGNITATKNVSASYFIGDGSQLTGIEQGELILYFLNTSSPDVAGVNRLSSMYNTSEITITGTGLADGNTLLGTWITDVGVPNIRLLEGNMRVHVAGKKTGGTKDAQFYYEVWKCNASGTDLELLSTSEYSDILTNVRVNYRMWALADETSLNYSDRIKVKGYVYVTSGGSAPSVEAYIQGASNTRITIPVGAVSIEKFVPYTGAVDNLVSTYNITASNFIGNGSQLTGITNVYHNEVKQYNTIIWTNSSVTSSGIATFYPTNDGTSGGTALFTNIYSVQALATANTTTATEYPFSSLKSISADKKTIQVNVGTGDALLLGGATIINAVDNTQVYITVIGD